MRLDQLEVSRTGYLRWPRRPPSARAIANTALQPLAANMLDRHSKGWAINQMWVADLTYIPTDEGWLCFEQLLHQPRLFTFVNWHTEVYCTWSKRPGQRVSFGEASI